MTRDRIYCFQALSTQFLFRTDEHLFPVCLLRTDNSNSRFFANALTLKCSPPTTIELTVPSLFGRESMVLRTCVILPSQRNSIALVDLTEWYNANARTMCACYTLPGTYFERVTRIAGFFWYSADDEVLSHLHRRQC
jgi:hypothetical protein